MRARPSPSCSSSCSRTPVGSRRTRGPNSWCCCTGSRRRPATRCSIRGHGPARWRRRWPTRSAPAPGSASPDSSRRWSTRLPTSLRGPRSATTTPWPHVRRWAGACRRRWPAPARPGLARSALPRHDPRANRAPRRGRVLLHRRTRGRVALVALVLAAVLAVSGYVVLGGPGSDIVGSLGREDTPCCAGHDRPGPTRQAAGEGAEAGSRAAGPDGRSSAGRPDHRCRTGEGRQLQHRGRSAR